MHNETQETLISRREGRHLKTDDSFLKLNDIRYLCFSGGDNPGLFFESSLPFFYYLND